MAVYNEGELILLYVFYSQLAYAYTSYLSRVENHPPLMPFCVLLKTKQVISLILSRINWKRWIDKE
jgi:hypothetical protein